MPPASSCVSPLVRDHNHDRIEPLAQPPSRTSDWLPPTSRHSNPVNALKPAASSRADIHGRKVWFQAEMCLHLLEQGILSRARMDRPEGGWEMGHLHPAVVNDVVSVDWS